MQLYGNFAMRLDCTYPGEMGYHGYVALQGRGVFAMPAELRRRLNLDSPGSQLEVTEREDGVVELRPMLPIPADQAWFWTKEWQEGERRVDEHIAAGRETVYDSAEEFLAALDEKVESAE